MNELIDRYRPSEMAVEELFFVKNITTGISVAEARGVILLAARERTVSPVMVSISSMAIKKECSKEKPNELYL